MATYANGLIEWGGGAGQPVYVRQPDGSMKNVGAPEHGESASYVSRAVSDPQVEKVIALYNAAPEMLNNEQKAFIASGMVGMDSFGQGYRWGPQNLFDNVFDPQQAGTLLQTGFARYLSPQDISAGQQFNYNESPAQQSARDDDGGMFGDLAPLLLAGAGLYFGLPALGEAFGGAAAGAGAAEAGGLSWLGNSGLATIPEAVAGMGAGTTAAAGGGLSWLGNEGLASIPEAVGSTQGGMFGAFNPGAVMDAAGSAAAYNPGAVLDAATAAAAAGNGAGASLIPGLTNAQLVSGGLSLVGGLLSGNAAQGAARTSADAQLEAARIAADAAKFRPVGVSTRFGQSQFQKDAQGNVIGAGYALSPDVKAQQDQLMAASGGMLGQFTGSQATTAPMGQAAQSMFNLGQGYLNTSPQAQAAKYLADQQALLATGRERDLSKLETRLLSQGRLGLATGGTSTGMMAANPEMEALRNAQLQQDLGLAAAATQGGMDYAKFGAGMVGSGGQMLRDMYGTQQASYTPYQTAMQGSQYLEGLGQNAMTLGMDIGRTTSAASGNAGNLLAQGMTNAANTMQPSNAYSPWGSMLTGAGNTVANMVSNQGQQQLQNQQMQTPYSFFPQNTANQAETTWRGNWY